jgi:hypothetical protein
MFSKLTYISIIAAVAFFVAPAIAQTPDGLTPALETVCDAETGAAYGLCNAYCEAMDCDAVNTQASDKACSKVRSNFERITGRALPCDAGCPCTDNPGAFPSWAAVIDGSAVPTACVRDGLACEWFGITPEWCEPPQGDLTIAVGPTASAAASSLGIGNGTRVLPPFCGDESGPFLPISPNQGIECKTQLDTALAISNVVCITELPH